MSYFKSKTQPYCLTCTKPISKATVTHWLRTDPKTMNANSGYIKQHHVETLPANKAEAQRLVNEKIVSVRKSYNGHAISQFTTWDGESYVDRYFCNGGHARDFGYICAHGGMVTKKYNDFIKRQPS